MKSIFSLILSGIVNFLFVLNVGMGTDFLSAHSYRKINPYLVIAMICVVGLILHISKYLEGFRRHVHHYYKRYLILSMGIQSFSLLVVLYFKVPYSIDVKMYLTATLLISIPLLLGLNRFSPEDDSGIIVKLYLLFIFVVMFLVLVGIGFSENFSLG